MKPTLISVVICLAVAGCSDNKKDLENMPLHLAISEESVEFIDPKTIRVKFKYRADQGKFRRDRNYWVSLSLSDQNNNKETYGIIELKGNEISSEGNVDKEIKFKAKKPMKSGDTLNWYFEGREYMIINGESGGASAAQSGDYPQGELKLP